MARIVLARLIKKEPADGLMTFRDEVPLGKIYWIDLDTRGVFKLLNVETGQIHIKELVVDIRDTNPISALPMECLELAELSGPIEEA